ncbi:hypothetical protein LWI29_031175 [Acer saccharum]|uniref:DEAD-box helicase OB fold domain-containing protein n=1 Tax=Acer saccharum TaxID=4024 RepID=A0AA39S9T5_ACESA|nr:hypothetical protein LWI29_031175 [Acer saccharum]
MAHYPMSPRHSRMLLTLILIMKMKSYSRANLVLGFAVAAAAALSLSNPFVMQLEGSHTDRDDLEQVEGSKTLDEEELLCQATCAGWVDRVAKRVRPKPGSGDRKVNAVRYQACMVKEDVFLHRRSLVADSVPESLVYSELLHTKRPYMHGATRVKSDWLIKYGQSLCSFSKSLEGSEYYNHCQTDQISRWDNPIFGPHRWELPLHSVPVISGDEHYVPVFACALLECRVLPC